MFFLGLSEGLPARSLRGTKRHRRKAIYLFEITYKNINVNTASVMKAAVTE